MSGEVVLCAVTEEPLDPAGCLAAVTDPACGGLALFAGVVRDHDSGRAVAALSYEAHPTAGTRLAEVCAETAARAGVHRVAAIHRVGRLEIGEVAVVVAVSTPHRDEAFAACRWLIDTLKADVPIWKKEHFVDGDSSWVGCP